MALVAGVTSQLLPFIERHPERVAAWLSARAGRAVTFDSVKTEWNRRGPLLKVIGLRVGSGAHSFPIGEAEILVSQYAGLLPGRSFTELRVRHLKLTVEQTADRRWRLLGLPGQQGEHQDPLAALEGLGELQIIGARLSIVAAASNVNMTIPKIDLRFRVDGDRVQGGARAWLNLNHAPLQVALEFARKKGDGRLYVSAHDANLNALAPLLRWEGIALQNGVGRAQAWVGLQDHRVNTVLLDAALGQVRLRGELLANTQAPQVPPSVLFSQIRILARWRITQRNNWRLDIARLQLQQKQKAYAFDGLSLSSGAATIFSAKRLDAAPLFAIASLTKLISPDVRRWLIASAPSAQLHDVEIRRTGHDLFIKANIEDASLSAVDTRPGIKNLAGRLTADEQGFVFDFDAMRQMRFDWPAGFGVPHLAKMRGEIVGWRDRHDWRIATSSLRIAGDAYGANIKGGLRLQGDGTRPVVDMAAFIDDAPLITAKKFWVRHRMKPTAVLWLNRALLSGQVQKGRALISGDLDDWPFPQNKGIFQADARISNAAVKFNPDWPALERLNGEVHFINDGFAIAGTGRLGEVDIAHLKASIAHFKIADLIVSANAKSDSANLLALLRQSPLQKQYGKTLQGLSVKGPAAITFALNRILRRDAPPPTISGSVDLQGNRLAHSDWDIDFQNARGNLSYDRNGFLAEELSVLQDMQPGKLSLRAGIGHVQNGLNAFEGQLSASLLADALLERAPRLAWMKPRIKGRSLWTVAMSVPRKDANAAGARNRLQLRSQLVGTTFDLPAPMTKAAATPLPTFIETALPYGDGEISVLLGDRLALRARTAPSVAVKAVLGGGGRVAEPPLASGLSLTGQTEHFDAIDWIALTRSNAQGESLPLRRLDISAAHLSMLGADFPNTRLRAVPISNGIALQADGVALSGGLTWLNQAKAPISGRFQRVHWRSAQATASLKRGAGPKNSPNPQRDDVDPSAVPALNFLIDDLRFGDAKLGNATIRTRPIAAGMRIEQLETRATDQRVRIQGDWTGRGTAARTAINATIDSQDFGALLSGFGFANRLEGGAGDAVLQAHWLGSPAVFKVGALEGNLSLRIKDGRLVNIEPGAGRVLGLLSLTEIPRRLTLDFRDFFSKGFAFNRIGGEIRFTGGQASSKDISIEGPAADIRISGVTHLREQSFDQIIEVVPKTGNLLTAVGAIAAGPVGAAVGAVANAVLQKPLGQVSAKTYRVTGPWSDPKVEVMSRTQSKTLPAQTPPSG